jgi:acyl-coenzyme A synthetase/AMP-(fatty) acid ligase
MYAARGNNDRSTNDMATHTKSVGHSSCDERKGVCLMNDICFADALDAWGDRPAIITPNGRAVSFAGLARLADETAARWGDARRLVLIEATNALEPIAAYLGALRKRHPVIIAASGSSEADSRIVEIYRPGVIFRRRGDEWVSQPTADASATALHDDLAVLLSTSGSTGDPKLVRLSRDNIASNATAIAQYLALREDRAITGLPWHYSYGLSVVNSYLASGSTLLLTEKSVVDEAFWEFFNRHGGTSLAGVPHTFELLERIGFRDRPPPGKLRYLTSAGGRLDPKMVTAFAEWGQPHGVNFFVMYGQTEAAPRMAYLPPEQAVAHPDTIGIPIAGGSFKLLGDDGGEISEPGEVGELVYRGPNVMMGYATRREDLSRGDETAELRTGDLACRTSEGLYRIVGRVSRFSKIFGLRINLDEVERHLAEEGVAARVSGNDMIIAVCALGEVDSEAIETRLSGRFGLARTAIVAYSEREYPLLSSGKIDNRAVLARGLQIAKERDAAPPVTAPGEAGGLRQDFAGLLGAEVDPQDSFVSLGGDSLSFVQASLLVEERLGFLPENWERLPVAELEALAGGARAQAADVDVGTPLQTEIMLRAIAIIGVVITHAHLFSIGGGAYLLLVFAGFAFARFQREKLWSGRIASAIGPILLRILAPYYALLLLYAVARGGVETPHWFLVGNFFPQIQAQHGILPFYWFIENFAQIMILFALLFIAPPLRRAMQSDAFASSLVLLAASFGVSIISLLLLREADQELLLAGNFYVRTPMFTFFLFVFGWCMYFASTIWHRYLLSTSSVLLFATVQVDSYSVWLILGTITAMWIPSVVVVAPMGRIASVVAASSFYIFIAHMVPIQIFIEVFGFESPIARAVAVLLGVLLGIVVANLVRRSEIFMFHQLKLVYSKFSEVKASPREG